MNAQRKRFVIVGRSPKTGARMYYTVSGTIATRGRSRKFSSVDKAWFIARRLLKLHPQLRDYNLFAEELRAVDVKKNPSGFARATQAYARELDAQADKFSAFTGHAATHVTKFKKPPMKAAFALGNLLAVEYRATRDGVSDRYRHEFRKSSQPLLVSDGSQLEVVGGRFQVTDRGIEDT